MRKLQGFTLIELLIVVAIIAILAAIAVPNFLEAQVRSKVSRAKSDQRSLATAIEAYYVDNNVYPAASMSTTAPGSTTSRGPSADTIVTTTAKGRTFLLRHTTGLGTITTPVAFITGYFSDPFADTRGLPFRYSADRSGWILGSWGPDTDEAGGGDLAWAAGANPYPVRVGTGFTDDAACETVYDSRVAQPSSLLLVGSLTGGGAYTYDPTNGTVSQGDVWRVKD